MSVSTKNRSIVGGGGGCGGGDRICGGDDDEDGGDVVAKEMGNSEDDGKKGKRGSCFRFRKVKRKLIMKKRNGVPENCGFLCGGNSFLCLKKPVSSDSGEESQTSDPNSPSFTYEMLRVFIEKNDFYSEECNPFKVVKNKNDKLNVISNNNNVS